MFVIVILGILAAVIASRIPKFVNKAKEGKTKGNLGTLRSTLNIYYSDNDGRYPVDTLATLSPKYLKTTPNAEMPGQHLMSSAVAANGGTNALDPTEAGGWIYENDETMTNWGDIGINCSGHSDSSGS